jgi:hypothetical protein
VWVIAETTDTPTRLRKIVVMDDQGRYLLPDLPAKASSQFKKETDLSKWNPRPCDIPAPVAPARAPV